MGRSNVRCDMAHTPQSPIKNRVRRDWIKKSSSYKDIITISHGALEALMMAEHRGLITVCDIDGGVIESTQYMAHSEYPDLRIRARHWSIERTVEGYCQDKGVDSLGVVDIDLAGSLMSEFSVLSNVLTTLLSHKAFGVKVLFTFRNGRDAFKGIDNRIAWLKSKLPNGVQLVKFTPYNSTRITEHAERKKGSAMCIVELEIMPITFRQQIRYWRKQGLSQVAVAEKLGCSQPNISYHCRRMGII